MQTKAQAKAEYIAYYAKHGMSVAQQIECCNDELAFWKGQPATLDGVSSATQVAAAAELLAELQAGK